MKVEDYRKLCHSLKSILYQIENCDKVLFSGFNLTPIRYDIIKMLAHHPGINYIDLSKMVCCTKGNTSRIITSLMEEGLITREENPEDRRSFYLYLTPSGQQLLKEVDGAYIKHIEKIIHMFNTDQLEKYAKISAQINEDLSSPDCNA